jgi:hypothetical protein
MRVFYTPPFIPKTQKPTHLCLSFSKAAYPENITPALLRVKQNYCHILYEYAAAQNKKESPAKNILLT